MHFLEFRANGRNFVGCYMSHSFATPQKNPPVEQKLILTKKQKPNLFYCSFFFLGDACSSKATVSEEQMDLNVAIRGADVPGEGLSRSKGRKKKKKRK